MKTLLSNALVVKWSNPAKYRLTEEVEKLLSIVSLGLDLQLKKSLSAIQIQIQILMSYMKGTNL